MNSVLQRFLISQRIWMLVGICLIGISVLATIAVTKARGQYLDLKKTEYIKLTESAIKVISFFHSAYENGEMTRIEARQSAKKALNSMALDPRNYYYVYNATHDLMVAHPFLASVYPDDTDAQIAASVKVYTEGQANAGKLRGWDHPSYTTFAIVEKFHPDDYTGFIEYYFYLWGEEKTPIVQYITDTDVPEFAEKKMAYASYFEPWDWVVFSGVYLEDEQVAFYDWLKSMIMLSSIILAIIFVMAWGISRSISQPLTNVVKIMDDISQGTGDLTKRLNVNGNNELSRLSKSFNIFVEKIAGIVQQVGSTNQNIVKLSQQMSGVMDATVSRSEGQLAETEMLASASNELSYSVKSVAERAQESSEAARSTEEASNQAQKSMTENIASVNKLSNALLNTQQHVTNMETYSNKVSSVLEVIVGIAEQTNLLALNAAIEAARAGEQGRGFAVVADEVRTLAQKTQSSTSEIHDIIESLQSGTSDVVKAMRDGIAMSDACVGTSSQASEVLQHVMQYVEKITQMNVEIASAVDEQSKVTQEIAASSQSIADSSKDNLEAAKSNMKASQDMNNDTEAMDALVKQFKT